MSNRKPELTITGTLKDTYGRTVKVGHRGSNIEVIVTPHSGHDGRITLDHEARGAFLHGFAEAELAIERAEQTPSREHAAMSGRGTVEQAARELTGIPDGI